MKRNLINTLGCLLLLGACSTRLPGQDEKKPTATTTPAETKETDAATPSPVADATPKKSGTSSLQGGLADLARYTPPGAELGVYVEVAKIKTGPLWGRFGPMAEVLITSNSEYTAFVAQAGWDPMKNVEAAYLSLRGMGASKQEGVFVLRATYDSASLGAAVEKEAGVTKESHAGATLYFLEKDLAVSFVEPGIILGGDPAEVKSALDNSKTPMKGSEELEGLLSAADSSKAIVMAMAMSESMKKDAAAMTPAMAASAGLYGHLDFASGIELKGGIRFGSEADASTAKTEIDKAWAQQKPMFDALGFGKYLTGVSWEAKGSDFFFSLVLSASDTMALVDQAMMMGGGMMGGGGYGLGLKGEGGPVGIPKGKGSPVPVAPPMPRAP